MRSVSASVLSRCESSQFAVWIRPKQPSNAAGHLPACKLDQAARPMSESPKSSLRAKSRTAWRSSGESIASSVMALFMAAMESLNAVWSVSLSHGTGGSAASCASKGASGS
eukprot:Amastigsp_a680195_6.p7 type:complete len:111 gc:universal Amastigsp_a680195_6:1359-1027(-)